MLRTWADYRGYATVRVRQGIPGQDTLTETKYFRGMNGDKASPTGGTRSVTLPAVDLNGDGDTTDPADAPAVNDEDAWSGVERQQTVFNGVDTDVVSTTVTKPWQSAPTATRDMGDTTTYARYSGTDTTWNAVKLDAAPGWRVTKQSTTFDAYGAPAQVSDLGDVAVSGDETCVKNTYARNTGINLLSLTARIQTFALPCGQAPTSPDDIVGDSRNSYDDHAYYEDGQTGGTPPTKGNLTTAEVLKDWNAANGGTTTWLTSAKTSYDPYGRVQDSWDIRGNKTTTTYTPTTGGPVTGQSTAQTVGTQTWTSSQVIEPAWGSATADIDINGKRTDITYDPQGRVTKVWLPNRQPTTRYPDSPSTQYEYTVRNSGGVNAITTKTLNPDGNYIVSYALFDGLLRDRQTQKAAIDEPGTVFTEKTYDAAGRVSTSVDQYYDESLTPGTDLRTIDEWRFPAETLTLYDRANRTIASVFLTSINQSLTEKWRTTTRYGGDRVYVDPPLGGTPTTTITDARGNTVELRQHSGPTTAGAFDATKYRYNRKNQLAEIKDPAGNAWTYGYDIRGRQNYADDPDKGAVTTVYNDYGDVTETIDARQQAQGQKLVYTYDVLGRRTGVYDNVVSDTTRRATWAYDPTGAKGQLASSSRWDGPTRSDEYKIRVTGYNPLYKSTGEQYTIPAAETGLAGTYSFSRSYKADGTSLATVDFPNSGGLGGEGLEYRYDATTGLPEQLWTSFPGAGTYVLITDYTAFGELGFVQYEQTAQGYVQRSFNYEQDTRRLHQATTARQHTPQLVADVDYEYNAAGDITKIADTTTADTQCFNQDYLRRLVKAWTPASGDCDAAPSAASLGGPAPYLSTWTFDPVGTATAGNLRGDETTTPAGSTQRTFTYPAAGGDHPHALTSVTSTGLGAGTKTYQYDTTGNTTCRPNPAATTNTCPPGTGSENLTWDTEEHLAGLTDSDKQHSYLYDANGTRLIARDPTGSTLYLPGQELRYNKADGSKTGTRYYTYAGQVCAMRQPTSDITWLVTDQQGTQQISIAAGSQNITQRRQTPYGAPRGTNTTWPNSKGFVGGDIDGGADPTGLTNIGARAYDPSLGLFISVDPLLDKQNPQQFQGYSYASYSPISFSDPTGEMIVNDGGGSYVPPGAAPAAPPAPHKPPKHPKSKCGVFASLCHKAAKTVSSSVNWARDNAKVVGMVAGIAAGAGVTGICLGASWGLGSVGCAALGGFVGGAVDSLVTDGLDRKDDSWQGIVGHALLSGAVGAVVGAGTAVVAAAATGASIALANGMGAKAAAGFAKTAVKDAARIGKACHSFDPSTPVVMANGTAQAIGTIQVGDQVLAHDPDTGQTKPEKVEQLHLNQDTDLTDVTVRLPDGATTTLKTTCTHPFWDTTKHDWVNAADLQTGDHLQSTSNAVVIVIRIHNRVGSQPMRDLTVADIHTYYVISGTTPVLVHNCNNAVLGIAEHGEALARQLRGEGLSNVRTFNDPSLRAVDPESGMAGWQMAVKDALRDEDATIHIALDDMEGATYAEKFLNAYNAGRGSSYGATDWEMAQVGLAVRRGLRSWGSIKFYHGGRRIEDLTEPDW